MSTEIEKYIDEINELHNTVEQLEKDKQELIEYCDALLNRMDRLLK